LPSSYWLSSGVSKREARHWQRPRTSLRPDTALWVRQAIEKLESAEREILMLREYEQLSYSEIADLQRMP
jgi:DNA-directed RNA polymerase specialized sigma24 family protein